MKSPSQAFVDGRRIVPRGPSIGRLVTRREDGTFEACHLGAMAIGTGGWTPEQLADLTGGILKGDTLVSPTVAWFWLSAWGWPRAVPPCDPCPFWTRGWDGHVDVGLAHLADIHHPASLATGALPIPDRQVYDWLRGLGL